MIMMFEVEEKKSRIDTSVDVEILDKYDYIIIILFD
jgi:hypothetical protein